MRRNILGSVGEMSIEILDQFPISLSMGLFWVDLWICILSVWKNVRMRYNSIMITDKTYYLYFELHLNDSMRCGFNYSSDF